MKRGIWIPLCILLLLPGFCLWNGRILSARAGRWLEQLDRAETLAIQDDWPGVSDTLSAGYGDFQASGAYLRMVCRHDSVDSAEELYRRCAVLARERERGGFLAELSALRRQLEAMADMERFSPGNIF